mmetsp:Transcript_83849/g.233948  ORF Transcript_83849/g.233948 Transcript_83849/m.233948 type:complete len:282 (-) Transcript_83849:424-1269(-)
MSYHTCSCHGGRPTPILVKTARKKVWTSPAAHCRRPSASSSASRNAWSTVSWVPCGPIQANSRLWAFCASDRIVLTPLSNSSRLITPSPSVSNISNSVVAPAPEGGGSSVTEVFSLFASASVSASCCWQSTSMAFNSSRSCSASASRLPICSLTLLCCSKIMCSLFPCAAASKWPRKPLTRPRNDCKRFRCAVMSSFRRCTRRCCSSCIAAISAARRSMDACTVSMRLTSLGCLRSGTPASFLRQAAVFTSLPATRMCRSASCTALLAATLLLAILSLCSA